jgi:hypothetical protein
MLEEARDNIRRLPQPLPGPDEVARIIETAARHGDPGLQLYVPGEAGMLLAAQPAAFAPHQLPWRPPNDLTIYRQVAEVGGSLCLTTAERWHQGIGALAELAATATATCATTMFISGRFPHVRDAGPAYRLVVALEGDVTIVDSEGGRVLHPGCTYGSGEISEIRTEPGEYALVLEIPEVSPGWVQAVLRRKAGFDPRMRADLPYHPRDEIQGYSLEQPTELVQYLNELSDGLFQPDTMAQIELLWRALTPPVAVVDPSWTLPHVRAPVSDQVARLNCPGGFVRFGTDTHGVGEWCAAGQVFEIPRHLEPLLVALLNTREGVPVDAIELTCPEGDPECVARSIRELATYGLIRWCAADAFSELRPAERSADTA